MVNIQLSPGVDEKKVADQIAKAITERFRQDRRFLTDEELNHIFGGAVEAIRIMNKVMKEHDDLEAVTIHPDTWVGKELLSQTKRGIDLRNDIHHMQQSITSLKEQVNRLLIHLDVK